MPAAIDRDPERHESDLVSLQHHPLVRAILPPVLLQLTDDPGLSPGRIDDPDAKPLQIPGPVAGAAYPVVGVIDSGVGDILESWVVGRFDYLDRADYDPLHGTGVAGLISVPQVTNDVAVTPERNGCNIYDAPLYPVGPFAGKYPRGFLDFLEEVEQAVAEGKEEHSVRIFNLSINAVSDVERHRYSIYASRLDQIADTYGVIFVNSAGNLSRAQARSPWPKRPIDVVRYFASRTSPDTIFKPAESVRSMSVGALNPPGCDQVEAAPTIYTTRGPGLQVGVKPDVAAFGGAGGTALGASTGLYSITPAGVRQAVAGTSYAAPLVARALAGLDAATEGGLTTEALRAMLLHHAIVPDPLTKRGLKDLGRQFAGFGQPARVLDMLETDDHQITLLFQSRLSIGERKPVILRFPFIWPQSLTNAGACSGRARITLVYSPLLDPAFGAEFVRVNLEAFAQAATDGAGQRRGRALPEPDRRALPTRVGPDGFSGEGAHRSWPKMVAGQAIRLHLRRARRILPMATEVTSLVRAESQFPAEGVPFAVLLTLEDPNGTRPVFPEFRQQPQASRANAQDVRTAVRLRPRG